MTLTPDQQQVIDQIIASKSTQYGVDEALIRAIIQTESAWDIYAYRNEPRINDASIGLMQVLVSTARWITGNSSITQEGLYDPGMNIDAGTHYLSYLQGRYGTQGMSAVVSAYNGGHPLSTGSGGYYNQTYVDRVMTNWLQYVSVQVGETDPETAQVNADIYTIVSGGPEATNPSDVSSLGSLVLVVAGLYVYFRKGRRI